MKCSNVLVGVLVILLFWFGCSPPSSEETPELEVSPIKLDFGESTNSLQLTIKNIGKGKLDWDISAPSEEWLSLSPSKGVTTDAATVDVRVNREGLTEGPYAMTLKVISDGGEADVQITMHVKIPPKLSVSPLSLDFGETSDIETFQIHNAGGDTLRWTATSSDIGWMSVSPSEGETRPGDPITIRVEVDRSKLGSGSFNEYVDVISERGGGRKVSVQITNIVPIPDIAPTALDFGVETKSLTVEIRNVGGGTLEWTVSASEDWMRVSPAQGGTSVGEVDKITVTVEREGVDPGDYTGQIRIVSAKQEDVVEVRMSVPAPEVPELSLSATSLSFDFVKTPPDPSNATFEVSNTGKGLLTWNLSSVSQEWVIVNPKEGTLAEGVHQEITVVVDRQELSPGTYGAVILVDSDGGTAEVSISVKVPSPPKLKVVPTRLDFGTDLKSLTFNIMNDGDGTLVWGISEDIAWMELSGYSGTTGDEVDEITVEVHREGIASGAYTDSLRVTSETDTVVVHVSMIVSPEPVLSVSATELNFGEQKSQMTFEISNAGGEALTWSISADQDWIAVDPQSGTNNATVTVTVDRGKLSVGENAVTLTVTSDGGNKEIQVHAVQSNASPTATIQSPADGSTFYEGDEIAFRGEGTDPEDGALSGASLVWSSDKDGQLGTGTSLSRSNLSVNIHTITLTVTDSKGASDTTQITVTVKNRDTDPPTVQITSPSGGASLNGAVPVQVTASDNVAVDRVTLYVDGAELSTDRTSPYVWTWDTSAFPNGAHILTAAAWDAAENKRESAVVSVTVSNVDTEKPTVSLTAPENAAEVSGVVTVTAEALDNVGVVKVDFFVNGAIRGSDASAPFLYEWDTGEASPGSYTLTAKAWDAEGNNQVSLGVIVEVPDQEAPTVQLTAPAEGATVGGSVEVTVDAQDNVAVTQVVFFIDGVNRHTDTDAPFAYTWDTTAEADGTHTLYAQAEDAAGWSANSTEISVTVKNRDTDPPTVQITSPSGGASLNGAVPVQATASDNEGVTRVEFFVDGTKRETDTTSPFAYTWDTTAETDGFHTLTAEAYDAAGNRAQTTAVQVTVANADAEAPTVQITSPSDGASLSGEVQVQATASDNVGVDRVTLYVDGTELGTDRTAPYTWTWDTSTFSNGTHTLTAEAWDAAENKGTSSAVQVTVSNVDTEKPTVTLTAPEDGAEVSGVVTVTAEALDNVGVVKVDFFVDGTIQGSDASAPFVYEWDTGEASPGSYTLTAKAWDAEGNNQISLGVTVEVPDQETPTVQVTAPAEGATVRGSVEMTVDAQDNVAVTQVAFYVDGVKRHTDTDAPFAYTWDTTAEADGTHTLYAQAKDAAGWSANSTEISVTVKNRDTDAPTVQITTPTAGSTVNHTITVTVAALDDRGVDRVVLYVDGVELDTDRTSPYTYAWNTEGVPDGSHTLTASAYDAAGNRGQATAVHVTVANADTQKPTVQITAPSDGARLRDQVPVQATASDNEGVERVEFYLDEALQHTDTAAPYTYDWDASAADGSHTLIAKAYDTSGNVSEHSVSVTVDNSAPEGDMVWIEGGTFEMGDPFNEFSGAERPVHTVTVDGFWMDKYEVSNTMYKQYDASHNSYNNTPEHPVEWVSWWDAIKYCNWRSRQEGLEACYNESTGECDFNKSGYRLPTEAEWEYAARGGLEGKRYPWGDDISHDDANYSGMGGFEQSSGTSPVASFPPNGYGLYDMAGNVWEWCSDWYDEGYYSKSPENNPTGAATGTYRVFRGGSWEGNLYSVRCADRRRENPVAGSTSCGFRCVRPSP